MPHGQLYLFSFTPLRRQRHACPLTETWAFWLRAIKRTTDTRIAIRTNGEYYILLRHSIPVSEAIVKYVITKEVTIHNLTSKGKAPLLIQVGHNAGNKRKRPGAQSSGAGAGADSNDSASEEHEDTSSCDSDSSASDSGTEAGAGVDVNDPVYQGLYSSTTPFK